MFLRAVNSSILHGMRQCATLLDVARSARQPGPSREAQTPLASFSLVSVDSSSAVLEGQICQCAVHRPITRLVWYTPNSFAFLLPSNHHMSLHTMTNNLHSFPVVAHIL
jgi:hypothetical protein